MENEGGGEEDEDEEKENYLEQANRIRARWWRGRTVEDDDKEEMKKPGDGDGGSRIVMDWIVVANQGNGCQSLMMEDVR